jgi:chaperonin GroEL
VVIGKVLEKDQYNYGYDAQHGEYGNLVSKGIIDPTKVVQLSRFPRPDFSGKAARLSN